MRRGGEGREVEGEIREGKKDKGKEGKGKEEIGRKRGRSPERSIQAKPQLPLHPWRKG